MADEMELLKEWIKTSKNIVFFGGAGVSTESNIPDFRSTDGLYNQEYAYPPETILSHSFYIRKPEEFFEFVSKCTAKCSAQSACKAGAAGKIKGSDHTKH